MRTPHRAPTHPGAGARAGAEQHARRHFGSRLHLSAQASWSQSLQPAVAFPPGGNRVTDGGDWDGSPTRNENLRPTGSAHEYLLVCRRPFSGSDFCAATAPFVEIDRDGPILRGVGRYELYRGRLYVARDGAPSHCSGAGGLRPINLLTELGTHSRGAVPAGGGRFGNQSARPGRPQDQPDGRGPNWRSPPHRASGDGGTGPSTAHGAGGSRGTWALASPGAGRRGEHARRGSRGGRAGGGIRGRGAGAGPGSS